MAGRPSKYQTTFPDDLLRFSRDHPYFYGSDVDIADLFAVDVKTVANWEKKYPAFADAIAAVNRRRITRSEHATLKSALGCTVTEEQVVVDPEGNRTVKTIKREIPPNITALRYLLNNRAPQDWSDKQETGGTTTTATIIVQESDAQLL